MLVSPKLPQVNGEAEPAVKTVKSLWRKNEDKNKALMVYQAATILGIELSPSQLSMGCRLRNTLPMAQKLLKPKAQDNQEIKKRNEESEVLL